jgi:hypothetical protein
VVWGEFDRATQSYGLATTGGQVSHTGIAGLTPGGGLGDLMGKHGATCDNLLSVNRAHIAKLGVRYNCASFGSVGLAKSWMIFGHPVAGTVCLVCSTSSGTSAACALSALEQCQWDSYRSLSAIAREVTGTRWNGFLVFGLTDRRNG